MYVLKNSAISMILRSSLLPTVKESFGKLARPYSIEELGEVWVFSLDIWAEQEKSNEGLNKTQYKFPKNINEKLIEFFLQCGKIIQREGCSGADAGDPRGSKASSEERETSRCGIFSR